MLKDPRVVYVATILATSSILIGACGTPQNDLDGGVSSHYKVVRRLVPGPNQSPTPDIRSKPSPPNFETLVIDHLSYPVATLPYATTSLHWPVSLPRGSRLRFGYTLSTPKSSPRGTIEFSVSFVDASGTTQVLYSREEDVDDIRGEVRKVEVPVSRSERLEAKGKLRFETHPTSGGGDADRVVVSWYDPILLAPAPVRRPNVVIICVDTLRADRLAPIGTEHASMPNLERRLKGAMLFEKAYANASWSLPSIASILTGLYPGHHLAGHRIALGPAEKRHDYSATPIPGGIRLIIRGTRYSFQMLHPSMPTIQGILADHGYYTSAIHANGYINQPTRVLKGMDLAHQYPEADARVGTDKAIEWLEQNRALDFFLFLHYIDPHSWPKERPERLRKLSRPEYGEKEQQEVLGIYDRLVRYTDRHLERFFKALEQMDLADETYVVLLADHGERFFEKGVIGSHGGSFYESVIHVPLALWGPKIEPRRIRTRVQLVDVVPTLLELVDAPHSTASLSGRSLVPLSNIRPENATDRRVISEGILWSDEHYALLDGPWKYLLRPKRKRDALFHLPSDPGEQVNRIEHDEEIAHRLRRLLARHIQRSRDRFARLEYGETHLDEETVDSLRALGYID